MVDLSIKSMTELRAIASGMGIKFAFSDSRADLVVKINGYATKTVQDSAVKPEPPVQDAVTRWRPVIDKRTPQSEIDSALEPYVARGLDFKINNNTWEMRLGNRTDSGNMAIPLRDLVSCAAAFFRG